MSKDSADEDISYMVVTSLLRIIRCDFNSKRSKKPHQFVIRPKAESAARWRVKFFEGFLLEFQVGRNVRHPDIAP